MVSAFDNHFVPVWRKVAPYVLALIALLVGIWLGRDLGNRRSTAFDQEGTVFNVMAYGARGKGSTSDTGAIQSAINAAIAAGGGNVYFPAGNYLVDKTLNNPRADLVSLVGSGPGSQLTISTSLGISLGSTASLVTGYHSGRIQGMQISCTQLAIDTAFQMTDMIIAPQLADLTVNNCNKGFDVKNQRYWTERITAINVTDNYNNHLFYYDQAPGNANNSYGYGIYNGIYINKNAGQDVFYLKSGAYLYHSTFIIKGNFAPNATGASIFNIQGASGEPCPGSAGLYYDISIEGGGSYSVVNAANNGCKGGATGNSLAGGIGIIDASGAAPSSTSNISDLSKAAFLVAAFTTVGSSSESVRANTVSPASSCYVQPINATAAGMSSGTYVSGTSWGVVNVINPSRSGGIFQIWCARQ